MRYEVDLENKTLIIKGTDIPLCHHCKNKVNPGDLFYCPKGDFVMCRACATGYINKSKKHIHSATRYGSHTDYSLTNIEFIKGDGDIPAEKEM